MLNNKRSVLNAQQTLDSLNMLNHITKANNRGFITGPQSWQPIALSNYRDMAKKIYSAKNLRVFTHQPTGIPTGVPNLYFNKLGQIVYPVIQDYMHNPFVNGLFRNITLHPVITTLVKSLRGNLLSAEVYPTSESFEHAVDICCSDFKVRCNTRHNTAMFKSWHTGYTNVQSRVDHFFEEVINESPRFEVHSIVVQLKNMSGRMPIFGDDQFTGQTVDEILSDLIKPIISTVWRKRSENDVIGILSKDEIDIVGDKSKRLIFFVKKPYSDYVSWTDTNLFKNLQPFFENTTVHSVVYSYIPSMNVCNSPLFQGHHSNHYDLNQSGISQRLTTLKSHIYGTDYWMRIDGDKITVSVEKKLH